MWISLLLPCVPATVTTLVFMGLALVRSPLFHRRALNRWMWGPTNFAFYYLLLSLPFLGLGWSPLWALPFAALLSPGSLFLDRLPGFDDGKGFMKSSAVFAMLINAPGLILLIAIERFERLTTRRKGWEDY